MEFKNITIKGDFVTYGKSIYSKDFSIDEKGNTWLSPDAIKLVDSKYTSFDISWDVIPGAKSYVVVLIDYDAVKKFGFPFIHWTAANIPKTFLDTGENISNPTLLQGVNSGVTKFTNKSNGVLFDVLPSGYKNESFEKSIGFYPLISDQKPHYYCLRVLGMSAEKIDIEPGFFLGDFLFKAQKYIVGVHNKWFFYKGN